MAYIIINGLTVEVQSTAAPRSRERIGEVVRSFGGTLRSTVRAIKRQWGPYETPPLTDTEAEALVTAVGLGIQTVSGDVIGASITADVEITGERDIKDVREATDFRRIVTFIVRES